MECARAVNGQIAVDVRNGTDRPEKFGNMSRQDANSHKPDRRVERTHRSLLNALIDLIVEKGYDRTTIQDILDRADVGRATFYAHFYNKEDLLLGRFSLFQLDVGGDGGRPYRLPDVTHLFHHVGDHRPMYLAMRGSKVLDATIAVMREDTTASFLKLFRGLEGRRDGNGAIDPAFAAQFLAGALISLVFWWLDEAMPESPQTMNDWFQRMGMHVLEGRPKG